MCSFAGSRPCVHSYERCIVAVESGKQLGREGAPREVGLLSSVSSDQVIAKFDQSQVNMRLPVREIESEWEDAGLLSSNF